MSIPTSLRKATAWRLSPVCAAWAVSWALVSGPVWAGTLQDWAQLWLRFEQTQNSTADAPQEEAVALASQLSTLASSGDLNTTDHAKQMQALGSFLRQAGKSSQALPLGLRALDITEKSMGPEHPLTARSLINLAITYSTLSQHDEALPLWKRVTEFCLSELGADHPLTGTSLRNLAGTYLKLGKYDEALKIQLRELSIREKLQGTEHPDTAFSLSTLANTYGALAQHDKALPLHLRSLAIREKVLGAEHPDTALGLGNLAVTYSKLAQHDKALPLQLRALTIREKVLGANHPDMANSLNNLAETYSALAHHDKVLPLHLRALAIREKVQGPEHPDTALGLNNLAGTYSALAQHEAALPLRLRALGIVETVLGSGHPRTAIFLESLAVTYFHLAHYEKALPLQLRALNIREKVLGADHPDTAVSLSNLAQTYSAISQQENALPLQLRALAIFEKVLGSEHPNTAKMLGNLALINRRLGEDGQALPLQLRALSIYEKTFGAEHPETAAAVNNLAATYVSLSQQDKALPMLMRAMATNERAFGLDHPAVAATLNNLAFVYRDLGQHQNALEAQFRSVTIQVSTSGIDHPQSALFMSTLGSLLMDVDQTPAAIIWQKYAVNAFQAQRSRVADIGGSELKAYTNSVQWHYQKLADALTAEGRLAEAQVVLDMLKEEEQFDLIRRSPTDDPRRTRVGYTSTEQRWVKRYEEIASQLAALGAEERALQKAAKLGLSSSQRQRQKALAADLVVARQAFVSYMSELQASFTAKGPSRAADKEETSLQALRGLQSLIGSLADSSGQGVALVQYYLTDERVNMLVTTPNVQLARATQVKVSELNRMIANFRRQLRDPSSKPMASAQALYQLLVAPIAQDLKQAGAQTVMLSLDGSLRYLPFAALHDGQQYLAQRWRLPVYTSVVRERLRDDVRPRWHAAGLGLTRAVGDFPALPAVRDEMRSIVKTDARASTGVLTGEVYLDDAFSASRLKAVGQRGFELLHVASHFRFSPGTEVNSYLLLGDGQRLTLGDIRTQGYRFDQVDLLTLSACETGLGGGRDENGREIEGFGVIAQQQGAKAVMATLWPVADQSTSVLMADLYRRRQTQGLNKAEALRQAQVAMLQGKYAHPFYWAPFILMGNWK